MTIAFDRQKGLVPALASTTPSARHCYCCHHIAENVKGNFKDDAVVRKLWFAAKSYRPFEYEVYMNDIRAVDELTYNYIHAIGKEHWANAFIAEQSYDMLTSKARIVF